MRRAAVVSTTLAIGLWACELPEFDPVEPNTTPDDVGMCDVSLTSAADYLANSEGSRGSLLAGHPRERAAFVPDASADFTPDGFTVGGRDGDRGLLLHYSSTGALQWGQILSGCGWDQVDDVASFGENALVASTTSFDGSECHTELTSWTEDGRLLWRTPLRSMPCFGSTDVLGSQVATDSFDGSAVVAFTNADYSELTVVRVGRDGEELDRRILSAAALGTTDLRVTSLDTNPDTAAESEVIVGLKHDAVLLDSGLSPIWTASLSDSFFGDHLEGSIEVAACSAGQYTLANVGVEWWGGEHTIAGYETGDLEEPVETWAVDMSSGTAASGTPSYRGPTGLIRGERANLRCGPLNTPDLSFVAGDSAAEYADEIRTVSFLHNGTAYEAYEGSVPEGKELRGVSGVEVAEYRFLAFDRGSSTFEVLVPDQVGWAVSPEL